MKQRNNHFPVWVAGAALLLMLVAVACQPSATFDSTPLPMSATASTAQETSTAYASATGAPSATSTRALDAGGRETRLTPALPPALERVPVSEPTLVTGEVPKDLLDTIFEDAKARTGIKPEEMGLLRAEAVIWNDGSLGCPQPDVIYTQAPVDGYWVVLQTERKELDYRATQSGFYFLCEQPLRSPGGVAPPTPQQ